MKHALSVLALAIASFVPTAQSADLPATKVKVVGALSNLTLYNDFEKPFWIKTIPEASGGRVTADIKGFNDMGLKGPEVIRLMSSGVIEFGTSTLAYFAADNPINEAIDLAGLATDVKTARAVTDACPPAFE